MTQITTVRSFENLIFEFRGIKVMIDIDLAALYETETKKLKQQVKRNIDRFPEDFMFEPRLSNLKYSPVNPLVFTEQGAAMLSAVLSTKKAVQINIEIMRAFAKYRTLLLESAELRKEIKALDSKLNQAFKYLLDKLDALSPKIINREPIGFKIKKNK